MCAETNIANRGIATQSSQLGDAGPEKAVDGNYNTNIQGGSCSMTHNYETSWWRLDLLRPYKIKNVIVTIREDRFYTRINGAEIRIGNSLRNNGTSNSR